MSKRWAIRWLPRVRYTNYKKQYENINGVFNQWFLFSRYWNSRIIKISILHHEISFDFRLNWLADMTPHPPSDVEQSIPPPTHRSNRDE